MPVKSCPDCAELLPEGVRYCVSCAEPIRGSRGSEPTFEPQHAPHEECPSCERPVSHDWVYCGACGERIEHLFHLQERGFSCGAAAVRNALAMLGLRQDEPHLRQVMGSRPFHGTPDEGFRKAAVELGLEHEHIVDGSVALLRRELEAGNPVVVDWRHGQHYVCAIAATSTHVVFIDSNPRDADIARVLTHHRFSQFWWDDEDREKRRHAMHVFRRPKGKHA